MHPKRGLVFPEMTWIPHLKNQMTKNIPCSLYIENHCMIFISIDIYSQGYIYMQMY